MGDIREDYASSGFLESYRDSRVPGDEANAAIKKALGW